MEWLPLPNISYKAGYFYKDRGALVESGPCVYEICLASQQVRRKGGQQPLATWTDDGYARVSIYVDSGKKKSLSLHTLVCWAAHGACPGHCSSVDHINRSKKDNNPDNLRWTTPKEQNENRARTVTRLPTTERFVPSDAETVWTYRGRPGRPYAGRLLQFTSERRIIRDGNVSNSNWKKNGYPRIYVGGANEYVHRLVWSAFRGPHAAVPAVINHIDHAKDNWLPGNLEATTHSGNRFAAIAAGRFEDSKWPPKKVRVCTEDQNGVFRADTVEYDSYSAASRALQVSTKTIKKSIEEHKPTAGRWVFDA